MQNVSEVYHEQYQRDSVSEECCQAFREIAGVLSDTFRPRTAIDVGCGGGALVKGLQGLDVDAEGIEGSVHAVNLLPRWIREWDLRKPIKRERQYDLVTCFDVAEHIEPEYADVPASNLIRLMHERSVLVFGAAPEGQDGLGHVNCQHPVYWLARLAPLQVDPHMSEVVRAFIKRGRHTDFVWWVAKNLMVLRHP